MNRISIVLIALLISVSVGLSAGCTLQIGESVGIYGDGEGYITIFNRVDELLIGDINDTVALKELVPEYRGKAIIGLGTTSMEHCGELLFTSGACYWADPTNGGRIVQLDWSEEQLPFCAVVTIGNGEEQVFTDLHGNIQQLLENKMEALGITLAAVEVKGTFDGVRLSVADRLPSKPEETLKSVIITAGEKRDWEFVGFYTFTENDQELISVIGHPVHLHGKTMDGNCGGHLQQANAVRAEVNVYPMKGYILQNKVPSF